MPHGSRSPQRRLVSDTPLPAAATIAARGTAVTALFLVVLTGGIVNAAVLAVLLIAILGALTAFEVRNVAAGRPQSR
jgi:hypothetical protein